MELHHHPTTVITTRLLSPDGPSVLCEGDVELLAGLVGHVQEDSQPGCERRQPVATPRRHSVTPLATSTVGLKPLLVSVRVISGNTELPT